jgi:hypothetical protein
MYTRELLINDNDGGDGDDDVGAFPSSPFLLTRLLASAKKALAASCDEFDTKPIEFDRLVTKVHRLLASRVGSPPRV